MQNELESQIQKIVESCGCALYDIEILNENESKIFRISITKNAESFVAESSADSIDSIDSAESIESTNFGAENKAKNKAESKKSKKSQKSKQIAQNPVTHEDCKKISEIVSPLLDVYNPIDDEYFLEVSSPGLERKLSKARHFKLSINENIEITLMDKTKIRGLLLNADDEGFTLDKKYYSYKEIKKAKSVFEF